MPETKIEVALRKSSNGVFILDIRGEVTAQAEASLTEAYTQATGHGASRVILNFEGLEYMNSSGIGLIVTLLIRAQRQSQRLQAYGLSDHYRQIFELTRLNEAIGIFPSEGEALAAA